MCRDAQYVPAHMIRESSTQNARAVRELEGVHRWCITGTPLQNRVSDISSLLRFLRVYPYDNPRVFDADIIQPWKKGMDKRPFYNQRLLVKMIALHRTKKVISLPPREETVQEVDFNDAEFEVYERAREGTIIVLDETLNSASASGSAYLNAFQQINTLRYICNHGTRYRNYVNRSMEPTNPANKDDVTEHQLDHLLDNSDDACLQCGTDISEDRESTEDVEGLVAVQDYQLRLCMQCSKGKVALTPSQLLTPPSSQISPSSPTETMTLDTPKMDLPGKIREIVSYVQRLPPQDKW